MMWVYNVAYVKYLVLQAEFNKTGNVRIT
jgi:hypothetical protein